MARHRKISRLRPVATALLFAGALSLGVSGVAAATADSSTSEARPLIIDLLTSVAEAPTDPDIEARPDDVWTSECDDDGNCQSVPGFMDPGPGAPGGPNGPLW